MAYTGEPMRVSIISPTLIFVTVKVATAATASQENTRHERLQAKRRYDTLVGNHGVIVEDTRDPIM